MTRVLAGLCAEMCESAGKCQSTGKRQSTCVRKGDSWLNVVLTPGAWPVIAVKDSALRANFVRLKARRGVKKAIVAIAAGLLRAVDLILTRNAPYHDLGATFFDRLDTTKATANIVCRLRALGYDVRITPAS